MKHRQSNRTYNSEQRKQAHTRASEMHSWRRGFFGGIPRSPDAIRCCSALACDCLGFQTPPSHSQHCTMMLAQTQANQSFAGAQLRSAAARPCRWGPVLIWKPCQPGCGSCSVPEQAGLAEQHRDAPCVVAAS